MNQFIIDPSVLVVIVLATCLACIWMVFFFGRRLQTSAYLRDSLIEGAKQQELKILLRELHDKALEGPLDPRNPPPDRYGSTRRLWERDQFISTWVHNDGIFLNETAEEKELRLEKNKELERIHEAENKWESEEKIRYELLRQQAETEAAKRAEKKYQVQ